MESYEEFEKTLIERNKSYSIYSVGKTRRKRGKNKMTTIHSIVNSLEKVYNQNVIAVYLNEDRNNEKQLHSVNVIFQK